MFEREIAYAFKGFIQSVSNAEFDAAADCLGVMGEFVDVYKERMMLESAYALRREPAPRNLCMRADSLIDDICSFPEA